MKVPNRPIGRRSLLIFGLAGGFGLASCTSPSELPDPEPSASATPTPDPLPGMVYAAADERRLAEFAEAMADTFADDLDTGDRRLLAALADAHHRHAAVLAAPDPLALPGPEPTPPPTSSPSARASGSPSASAPSVGGNPHRAFERLAAMETDAAEGYRWYADPPRGPEDQLGLLGLLWGSLAAASTMYAEACDRRRNPGREPVGVTRLPAELPSPTEAMHHVVAQCYPMIFGYQTAIAKLSGSRGDHARAVLSGYRDLRDVLSSELVGEEVDVPTARAAYELPVQPEDDASAAELLAIMERRMLPHLGQWLATAEDRTAALDAMINTARETQIWSPAIMVWPGWPTE